MLRDGELVYADAMGYANREHGVQATTSTLYPVASISKLVSSTALHMLLEEKGRSVDETVGELLPRRIDLPETWRRLTLRQLLSHSSGVPDVIDYGLFLVPASDRVLLDTLADKPFAFHPGAQTRYNATGFFLVRLIIEGLSGHDFESYIQQTVLDPIGMKTARYGGYLVPIPDRAKAYRTVDESFELFPLDATPPLYAAAGLNVSVLELSAWLEAVLAGELVSREHLETIWTPVLRNDGSPGPFGLGWAVDQQGDLWINGHGGAGISSVQHYRHAGSPHTISVILLTNGAKSWRTMPDGINWRLAEIFGLGDGFPQAGRPGSDDPGGGGGL